MDELVLRTFGIWPGLGTHAGMPRVTARKLVVSRQFEPERAPAAALRSSRRGYAVRPMRAQSPSRSGVALKHDAPSDALC